MKKINIFTLILISTSVLMGCTNDPEVDVDITKILSTYDSFPTKLKERKAELFKSDTYKQLTSIYQIKKLGLSFDQSLTSWNALNDDAERLKVILNDSPWWVGDETVALKAKMVLALGNNTALLYKPSRELTKIKKVIDSAIANNDVGMKYIKVKTGFDKLNALGTIQKTKHSKYTPIIEDTLLVYDNQLKELNTLRDKIDINLKKRYALDIIQFERDMSSFDIIYKKVDGQLDEHLHLLNSLDESYSKILSDMKGEFHVKFGKTYFDSYDEDSNEIVRETKWIEIDPDDFYNIAGSSKDLVATCIYRGWLRTVGCTALVPNIKKYLPMKAVRSSDTDGEFWVQETKTKFSHQYTIERNGKLTTTPWTPISDEFYWKHINDKGLALETKAFGTLSTEKVTDVTPAGLAYVGNPHYGHYSGTNWIFLPSFNSYNSYGGNDGYSRYGARDYDTYRTNRRNGAVGNGYYNGINNESTARRNRRKDSPLRTAPPKNVRRTVTSRSRPTVFNSPRSSGSKSSKGSSSIFSSGRRSAGTSSRSRGAGRGGK